VTSVASKHSELKTAQQGGFFVIGWNYCQFVYSD